MERRHGRQRSAKLFERANSRIADGIPLALDGEDAVPAVHLPV
jgi:hypothetical protein